LAVSFGCAWRDEELVPEIRNTVVIGALTLRVLSLAGASDLMVSW
jgi:hypothetical protein